MRTILALIPLLASTAAYAAPEDAISEARLRADVEKLVSFGTRHTLSSQTDPKRGIGAARTWAESEFRKTSAACGNCLEIVLPETVVTGDRVPAPTRLVNVVAIQRGTERPNEVVIVQGHIDSRVSNILDATSDAPGANDNASGTALVLEAARALSREKFPTTVVYAALSGEEQGLLGGKLLADYATAQGWTVKAVLNNDIVGGSTGSDGYRDNANVRVLSEALRADSTDALRAQMRRFGGENDSPSRNISRWVAKLAEADTAKGLAVRQIWRADRMGRGGDQLPFSDKGYPAVRFTVAVEDYEHQHQDLRTEGGVKFGDTVDEMDFPYLAKVTRLNVRALAKLARTPMPPAPVVKGAVKPSTDIEWQPVPGAVRYSLWQRRTDAPMWQTKLLETADTKASLPGVRADDWLFGVNAVAADGSESPIASAVPGGQFAPLISAIAKP
ncbi:MAG: peptidase M28 [Novosphingobium sp. 28-62-57]|uniref:M20/M25/M40 family metallo-hydrolase n=1 Tax=Novosphingobium sp. 28-62-57 TaxID=1970409 RepID=UPI000BCF519F|nr:M20/M25/M40 family metallo-hydrolase [Novosphingobium sp. 28-62-57]OYW49573.1 MAG: peptidase M28 [Novosphingobium sp. 12-62-10]OYZ12471.1 MAG: peptidase M28 [Novosphingobium sp. 28-62-57]OZA32241.1 MAG: peptidase M28 [Novosphingobium sp. 17-62-9]HQS70569.1 M20/M25/M40 family metallo-hydrolase [Novosphingobium sp.]